MNGAVHPADLINFIAWNAQGTGLGLSKIRIIKFLYLADVHAFRHSRTTLTRYSWIFYHYGPWTVEAQRDLDDSVTRQVIEPVSYSRETEATEIILYRARSPFITSLPSDISPTIEFALKNDIRVWSRAPLNTFLNYVYFDTPPMRDAHRGDRLRFEPEVFETPPADPPRKRYTSRPSREAFARLLAHRNESAERVPIPRDAIIDDDYVAALGSLDAQDHVQGLRGAAEADPDKLGG